MLGFVVFIAQLCIIRSEFTIMQISDFHLDTKYSREGDPRKLCHLSNRLTDIPSNKLGVYGDYMCDSPMPLVENAVNSSANLFPNPDMIVWTGDNVPHIEEYDQDYVMDAINKTTNQLKKYFPNVQILPTYGNHDHAPPNQFSDEDQFFYSRTFELWKDWIGEKNRANFLKGAYYRLDYQGAIFLVLNTNLYYRFDQASFKDPFDPAGQFLFMETELENARENGQLVNIIAHIAPGMYERKANFSWFYDKYNARFLDIVKNYRDVIKTMIFGHHHTDTFHIVRDNAGSPFQVCYMCPAVTPWYSDLGEGANNPAFRIYSYSSTKTWELQDIFTYYVNLTELNRDPTTKWQLEYSFKNAYSLKDFSAKSIDDLVSRFNTNDTLYQQYLKYNSVLYATNRQDTPMEKSAQICSLSHADYVAYRKCLDEKNYVNSRKESFLLMLLSLIATINFF